MSNDLFPQTLKVNSRNELNGGFVIQIIFYKVNQQGLKLKN